MYSTKKTVLVVDDSRIILERIVDRLKSLENTDRIIPAVDFSEALLCLERHRIDIALFDIHLNGKSGIDLLRITKERYPATVVIMFTNEANEQIELLCIQLGAAYFLDKSKDFTRIPEIISSIT